MSLFLTRRRSFARLLVSGRLEREIGACLHRDLVCNVPDDF